MTIIECSNCGTLCPDIDRYKEHLRRAHARGEIIQCPRCSSPFNSYENIRKHFDRTCLIEFMSDDSYMEDAHAGIDIEMEEIEEMSVYDDEGDEDDGSDRHECSDDVMHEEYIKQFTLMIAKLQNMSNVQASVINDFFVAELELFETVLRRMGQSRTEKIMQDMKSIVCSEYKRNKFMKEEIRLIEPSKVSYSDDVYGYYIKPSDAIKRIFDHNFWSEKLIKSFDG